MSAGCREHPDISPGLTLGHLHTLLLSPLTVLGNSRGWSWRLSLEKVNLVGCPVSAAH